MRIRRASSRLALPRAARGRELCVGVGNCPGMCYLTRLQTRAAPYDTGAVRDDSIQPKGNVVVEIQLAETDRLDWALKQFRRRMIRSGLFKDMRRKRFYEKPSEARKAKAKAAERRRHKDRKRARAAGRFGL